MIYLYNDKGASQESVQSLMHFFQQKNQAIQCVLGNEIARGTWMQDATLLIIPGGRSLPFYKTLGDAGNSHIKNFVGLGGCYVGLCAGAYYACSKTIFAKNLPLELMLPGALNFFKGNAVGPVFAEKDFAYQSESGARMVDIQLQDGDMHFVYCNGGCYFENAENFSDTKIMATYIENNLPAIIVSRVGKGRVILSGVHPELTLKSASHQQLQYSVLHYMLALLKLETYS